VHVFNEPALELLGRELDTVTDFTDYLTRREQVIRSRQLLDVGGEHDLLACYLCTDGPDGSHDFPITAGGQKISIAEGTFNGLAKQPQYMAKRKADEVSYKWDQLIGHFAKDILEGIAVSADGDNADLYEAEEALRSMALERRLHRRLLGQSVGHMFREAEDLGVDRFARVMLPQKRSADRSVGYIVLILAYREAKFDGDYDLYRRYRKAMLEAYCLDVLDKYPDLKRSFAIGFDASPKVTGRKGGSEDIVALEIAEWTPALKARLDEGRKIWQLMRPENVVRSALSSDEFPLVEKSHKLKAHHIRRMECALRQIARRLDRRKRHRRR